MPLKIVADTAVCQGTACCMMESPGLCDVDEQTGKVIVLVDEIGDARRAEAETAVRACPTKALELQDC
ncbi:ferredoxin [Amycolatopsis orientalis]|uniref:ferredoxin n=1 Tax=Amycolatopsis orientalis TaxID=31958 RepID=UPI0003A28690|nr:ferredoxin [Amycolatopsis orientalis]